MPAAPPAPHAAPPSLGRRLGLLMILLILPIGAMSLPTLVVTHFFGQRPAAKQTENASGFDALRGSLEKAARESLPDTGLDLGARFDALTLACAPEQADARLEALRGFAERCEGASIEQPADAAGRHLLVELPASAAARFRQLALEGENAAAAAPPSPPPAAERTPAANAKVFLNVTLAPTVADSSGSPGTTAAVKTTP